jgi:hypothetical protein
MNRIIIQLLAVCLLVLSSNMIFAQTGSDYYLPLSIGSQLNLHTVQAAPNWSLRTTIYGIEGSDLISGKEYFRERGTEIADGSSEVSVFHIVWIRKDSVGNVLLGAISLDGSADIDSAYLIDFIWFPNEFLIPGYSRTYTFGDETSKDSVISTNETITVPSGTYNNCLKISVATFDSSGTPIRRDIQYYANGIGMVKKERTFPNEEGHTDELISYVTGLNDEVITQTPNNYLLSQNYPNPFNPSTTISYKIPVAGNVTLKIYNLIGEVVTILVDEEKAIGNYEVQFDASRLTSGVYFYRLQSNTFTESKKLILMK